MEFLPPAIDQYAGVHTEAPSHTLAALERETWQEVLMPRMLSGHQQGRFLSLISHLLRPSYVLEIGTYTGYSALCMAEGLAPEGHIHTLDINAELKPRIERFMQKAGMKDRITLHIGDALDIIPTLQAPWDLVFIDADKENYCTYFDLVVDTVRPGGLIIADNVLWSGKVVDPKHQDHETAGLRAYNEKIAADPRVAHQLLPFRDGLMVARKLA
ncbi:MAG TPA: methyltransferase [Cryomorphaceae bacterium]|jgi:caffeoyl-CoA O-methyltransferase|nr:MAG: methyltransferase [Cryomorphaceae bacterium BACL7 MAG-120322-bin74]NQW24855.1 O-methyltransferase [Cryomorphaceae bacterium]HAB32354.1 methyltransferase [Cryomorphaceae bacterium]HAG49690.1 methyltransferase [Cryomorphaceae bacterium]